MYTIKISDDNSVITTVRETIMQRSNIVDNICFLTPQSYKGQVDMSDCTVYMKYNLPVSYKTKMIKLEIADKNYNNTGHIKYVLPMEIPFTAEAGEIEISFTFIKLTTDENGNYKSYIRKTQPGYIRITPVAQFELYEPDEMFGEVDQRLILMEGMLKDLEALSQQIYDGMATDMKLDKDKRLMTLIDRYGENMGEGVSGADISHMIGEDLIGIDPDGTIDGITNLDNLLNGSADLDKLIK